ncbi:MAG: hypothetical protein LBB88_01555 [Planctomycetaceae bacterium]|jgi:hypothetical protein|nr:hypothetical protein [Planctomycetaceae bacterium]
MNITTKQFLKNFKNGKYNSDDRQTQCDAGWFDWFCQDSKLQEKTMKLAKYLQSIVKSKKINVNKTYVLFKNNCPLDGKLYDDFRICDIKTDDVIYTIIPRCGHNASKGKSEVWGKENNFKEPLTSGNWKNVQEFFEVEISPTIKRKPRVQLTGKDSNIFNLLAIASRALRENKMNEQSVQMSNRVKESKSFDEALSIIMEYVNAY